MGEGGKPGLDRRSAIIGASLASLAGLSILRTPEPSGRIVPAPKFRAAIPSKIGGWSSRRSAELVLPELDGGEKLYENLETRIYEGKDLPSIMFLVAYSSRQLNDIQVHRPEVCYPVAGFPIISTKPTIFNFRQTEISARDVVADRGGYIEQILYWVRVGGHFPTTWVDQRIVMAVDSLKGRLPDGVLVRFSIIQERNYDGLTVLESFATQLLERSAKDFRESILI